ncbi:MAG TPA: hypothetical protein DDW65_23655 [Firmicutes bacterium]|jgi:ribose transport system substrate-binding protein|nr:hypothetical protein [Bacillota bacterium]
MLRRKVFTISFIVALLFSLFIGSSFAKGKVHHFGATYMTLNNPFFVTLNEGIKKLVESKGDKLTALDPALDQNKQISEIEDLISQKVDAIFLNPVDWKGVKPALDEAKKANIPIINVDAPVYDQDLVASIVASDNWNAGILCAEDMIKRVGNKPTNVVILEHPTAKSAIDRTDSFKQEIKKYPNIKVVADQSSMGQLEQAMPVMENILQAQKQIDVVMCLNDPTALGAIAAMESANRTKGVLVYGVDGSPDAKKMIQQGKLTATASQFPSLVGKYAAQAAYSILSGKKVEHLIKVPVQLIDKSNLAKHKVDAFE